MDSRSGDRSGLTALRSGVTILEKYNYILSWDYRTSPISASEILSCYKSPLNPNLTNISVVTTKLVGPSQREYPLKAHLLNTLSQSPVSSSKISTFPPTTPGSINKASNSFPTTKLPTRSSIEQTCAPPNVAKKRISARASCGVSFVPTVDFIQTCLETLEACLADSRIEGEYPPLQSVPRPTLTPPSMIHRTLASPDVRPVLLIGQ